MTTFLILHGIGGSAGDHWQAWLKEQLTERGHDVLMPTLPNAERPARSEWLNKVIELTDQIDPGQLFIVGHSLGVPIALDYIEQASKPLAGLASVAGFARDYGLELNSYFLRERDVDLSKVRNNVKRAVVFYGDNDPYVPQDVMHELAAGLSVAPNVVPDGGHLNTDTGFIKFPALLDAVLAS